MTHASLDYSLRCSHNMVVWRWYSASLGEPACDASPAVMLAAARAAQESLFDDVCMFGRLDRLYVRQVV